MFSYIRGRLIKKTTDAVIVENQGIGYRLAAPASTLSVLQGVGEEVTLHTYLAVRDDGIALYGFSSPEERQVFEMLLSVSGVGPKAALAVLSSLAPADFYLAILHENVRALTRAPGIGPKSAKRMIMELKEKLSVLDGPEAVLTAVPSGVSGGAYSDAYEALLALGYSGQEAQAALRAVETEGAQELAGQDLLKRALTRLGAK